MATISGVRIRLNNENAQQSGRTKLFSEGIQRKTENE